MVVGEKGNGFYVVRGGDANGRTGCDEGREVIAGERWRGSAQAGTGRLDLFDLVLGQAGRKQGTWADSDWGYLD